MGAEKEQRGVENLSIKLSKQERAATRELRNASQGRLRTVQENDQREKGCQGAR